jgi:murein DD-endopeptidase MepM/ murein hydrolase activator NlpD
MKSNKIFPYFIALLLVNGCGEGSHDVTLNGYCTGYPEYTTSSYRLPYVVGAEHKVSQGNCTPYSHSTTHRYSYDLDMEIGTKILAMREGTVIEVKEDGHDSSPNHAEGNYFHIQHSDGTVARYGHPTHNGVLAQVGDAVTQGQWVASSGSAGTKNAHLHVEVFSDSSLKNSIPITFSNTSPNPGGLQNGSTYRAEQ